MKKLHHQAKAREDLKNIWLYSFRAHGEKQADAYFQALVTGMKAIESNPEIGMPCDAIRPGYRRYQINHHIVFYRLDAQRITVIRVLHRSMDFFRHIEAD